MNPAWVIPLAVAATHAMNTTPLPPSIDDAEVLRHVRDLRVHAGSPADLRQRERAWAWLLAHAQRTLPVALAAAARTPGDATTIDLLGRLRRAEATPWLVQAWTDHRLRPLAAAGLGLSPDPAAADWLMRTLGSPDAAEVSAALAGLGARRDPALCGIFRERLDDARAEVRWMAVEAGCRNGCIDAARLAVIARDDPDTSVQTLARRWADGLAGPDAAR